MIQQPIAKIANIDRAIIPYQNIHVMYSSHIISSFHVNELNYQIRSDLHQTAHWVLWLTLLPLVNALTVMRLFHRFKVLTGILDALLIILTSILSGPRYLQAQLLVGDLHGYWVLLKLTTAIQISHSIVASLRADGMRSPY